MRISDWSSDVCSSDLADLHPVPALGCVARGAVALAAAARTRRADDRPCAAPLRARPVQARRHPPDAGQKHRAGAGRGPRRRLRRLARRSEEHTSELQALMRISYAVFCLKKKKKL